MGELEGLVRARRRRKLPVVLTVEEVKRILVNVEGVERLFLSLLYGTGLRLTEACAQPRRPGRTEPDRCPVAGFAPVHAAV